MADQSKPYKDERGNWCKPSAVNPRYKERWEKEKEAAKLKPWDFIIYSEKSIPNVLKDGRGSVERNCFLIDFKVLWHTNDNRGEVKTKWQALYADRSSGQPEIIFVNATGSNADVADVPSTIETCDQAVRWVNGEDSKSKLTMSLNLDCSEALKGLKAVQREARETAKLLKNTQSANDSFNLYVGQVFRLHDTFDNRKTAKLRVTGKDSYGCPTFSAELYDD